MKKRILAFAMATALLFSLAACGSSSTSTTTSTASTATSRVSTPPEKVVMTFITWTGAPADTAIVQEKINEILRERLNAELELQIYDIGSYKQSMTLALASGEQLDIVSGIQLGYANLVAQGYLTDLEEDDLLATYGSGIIDAIGMDFIDACRIDGALYGLPQNRDMAVGRGCIAVKTECLDAIGYTAPADAGEIIPITQAELVEMLGKIHEAFPEMETYRPTTTNSLTQFTDFDGLGGNAFGVLLNYGADLTVENLFDSEAYKEYCQMMYDWNKAGFISRDAATDTTAVATLVKAGTLAAYTTGGKPGSKVQESTGCGTDMTIFQTKENFVSSSAVASFPWTIPINSANPTLAMQVLNELYSDPELSTLLIYGIENQHYSVTAEGAAEVLTDASGASSYGTLGWLAPNQFISYVLDGNPLDLWEATKTFNDSAKMSAACGFTFDGSNVATEMAAVQNVYDEYQMSVEFGFLDPATALPEMNAKMMAAGLQVIIDEKQSQLDAWAAAQ